MADAISIRKKFPKEGILEYGFIRGEAGPPIPLYVRGKILDLVWPSPRAVDQNGARLVSAIVNLVDHPGQTRGNAFSDMTDEDGNLLPQFAEMDDGTFIRKMKGYATNIKSFAACVDGMDPDADEIDTAEMIGKTVYGAYLPSLSGEAAAAGFDDKDALKKSGLAYSVISEWISKESFEAHTANGDAPLDDRKRLWVTDTPAKPAARPVAPANGGAAPEGSAASAALPTAARRRPGVRRAAQS